MNNTGLLTLSEDSLPAEGHSISEEISEEGLDEFKRPLTRYLREKELGIRRDTGALKLKRLTQRHLRIVNMHLRGWTGGAIAVQLNCSQQTVTKVLNDPLVRNILNEVAESTKGEIRALIPQAVAVVREGLSERSSLTVQFKAIDKLEKLQNLVGETNEGATAEDLVQQILASGAKFDLRISNQDEVLPEKVINPIESE